MPDNCVGATMRRLLAMSLFASGGKASRSVEARLGTQVLTGFGQDFLRAKVLHHWATGSSCLIVPVH